MPFLDSLFGKKPQPQENITVLPATDFLVAVLDKEVQLVDVRTPREYNRGYIKGAINIDWLQRFRFKKAMTKFDKEQPVYVYCRTGSRSQKAAKELAEFGFTQIYDLQGGITAMKL